MTAILTIMNASAARFLCSAKNRQAMIGFEHFQTPAPARSGGEIGVSAPAQESKVGFDFRPM
jgi:hypothetical protein